jgi:hypothetical protein
VKGFPAAATGVSASPPTTAELTAFTRRFVNQYSPDDHGLGWNPNKVARVCVAFNRAFPHGSWLMFWGYLAWHISDAADHKIAARACRDLQKFIDYADPTGDTAVRNVMRRLT